MWDVSHIDEREFTYMGYEVELEIFTERDYTDTRKRVVQATARKDNANASHSNPMQNGDHVINVRDETNSDGEKKLFGLVEVKPTPLDEQIEDVVQETKDSIETSVDERLESRKEADDVLDEALDDQDIELPPEDPENDDDE